MSTTPVTQPPSPPAVAAAATYECGYANNDDDKCCYDEHTDTSHTDSDDDDVSNGNAELLAFLERVPNMAFPPVPPPTSPVIDRVVNNLEMVAHQALTFHTVMNHTQHTSETLREIQALQQWLTSGQSLHPYEIMGRGGQLLLEAMFAYRPPTHNLQQLAADDACIRMLAAYGIMHRDVPDVTVHNVLTDWAAISQSLLTRYQCMLSAQQPQNDMAAVHADISACVARLHQLYNTGLVSHDVVAITWPHLYHCLHDQDCSVLSRASQNPFVISHVILRAACDLLVVDMQRASTQTNTQEED